MHSLPALFGEGAGMLHIRQCGLNLSPRSMLSSNRVAAISSCNHAETAMTRSLLKEGGGGELEGNCAVLQLRVQFYHQLLHLYTHSPPFPPSAPQAPLAKEKTAVSSVPSDSSQYHRAMMH